MLPKPRLGGNSATAKSTGSGSSGTTAKSLTMATRTLFGSRFQNAWIALPGRVEPFNSASYVVVASPGSRSLSKKFPHTDRGAYSLASGFAPLSTTGESLRSGVSLSLKKGFAARHWADLNAIGPSLSGSSPSTGTPAG